MMQRGATAVVCSFINCCTIFIQIDLLSLIQGNLEEISDVWKNYFSTFVRPMKVVEGTQGKLRSINPVQFVMIYCTILCLRSMGPEVLRSSKGLTQMKLIRVLCPPWRKEKRILDIDGGNQNRREVDSRVFTQGHQRRHRNTKTEKPKPISIIFWRFSARKRAPVITIDGLPYLLVGLGDLGD